MGVPDMGAAVLDYVGALHTGVQLVRDARSLIRDWKGGTPEELEQKLEQAEQQLTLAEVAAAEEHGFLICKKHWPPGIMLDEGSQWRCRDCGSIGHEFVIA